MMVEGRTCFTSMEDAAFGESALADSLAMVIKGYFDDSSDGKRERFCAVGGLMGGRAQWFDFEKLWSVATYELKAPFHSTDCEARRGCCEGWPSDRCASLMKQLAGIIDRTKLHGVGFVVPVSDYLAVFPNAREYDPYFLALKQAIINMAYIGRNTDANGPADIHLIHECGSVSHTVLGIFRDLKALKMWPDSERLKMLSHGDKSLTGLQGADLVAREAFKHADNIGVRPIRKPLKALKDLISFHLWTRECLEYLRDKGGQDNLVALALWGQGGEKPPQMVRLWREGFQ
jgi:hypothetical protein